MGLSNVLTGEERLYAMLYHDACLLVAQIHVHGEEPDPFAVRGGFCNVWQSCLGIDGWEALYSTLPHPTHTTTTAWRERIRERQGSELHEYRMLECGTHATSVAIRIAPYNFHRTVEAEDSVS